MNSTLLKTPPFIHRRPSPSSRISEHFAPFRYHHSTNSLWKQKLQISRTSNVFNTIVYPKNSVTSELEGEESTNDLSRKEDLKKFGGLVRCGFVLGLLVLGVIRCQRVLAAEGRSDLGVLAQKGMVYVKGFWNGPKLSQVFRVFREQGLILAALLGLSAFFSMAETSITTLSPWKVKKKEKLVSSSCYEQISLAFSPPSSLAMISLCYQHVQVYLRQALLD